MAKLESPNRLKTVMAYSQRSKKAHYKRARKSKKIVEKLSLSSKRYLFIILSLL